jgi:hypothetical protein
MIPEVEVMEEVILEVVVLEVNSRIKFINYNLKH